MGMLEELARVERRFLEIENMLSSPEVAGNAAEFRRLSRERASHEAAVKLYRQYKKVLEELKGAEELLEDPDMKEMAVEEQKELEARKVQLEEDLKLELLPKDPNEGKDIIVEIRAGAGGDEASIFAGDLLRLYLRYCERSGWKTEMLSSHEKDTGGYKEVTFAVKGEEAWRLLKFESGVHRVQRVPVTETQGRIHTSTATVAVLAEADEVDVQINESELRIDTYRAGGAGGQHVNKTDSAVRITHVPTGIVVACQDERSQIKNRSKAMKILQARLYEIAQEEAAQSASADRKSQVGRGDRSERIRTYNYPQGRVTDHRIGLTVHNLGNIMDGDLVEISQKLVVHYQTLALKEQSEGK